MRAVLMIAVLAVAVPDRPDRTPKDATPPVQNPIIGDWQDMHENYKMLKILPTETVFHMHGKPSPSDGLTANIVVDWTKNPVTIDFMPKSRGGKMLGYLKLEGDWLTISLNHGEKRPVNLNSGSLILHYQRVKK